MGWRIGDAHEPRGGELWVPWDRTAGVIGPQGSGKTLDLLTPALLAAPGAALVTLTKVEDLLLSLTERSPGTGPASSSTRSAWPRDCVEELIWDPIAGCVDSKVAERRAKAFTAGTVKGAIQGGTGDDAARFYAAESAKVLQGYFHAAALTGKTLEDVLQWVANPAAAIEPIEILRRHPHAEPFWHGLLHGALNGDDRTAGNTITTVQQALAVLPGRHPPPLHPRPRTPGHDLADVIRRRGTIYLLGRERPLRQSARPLMTAVAEHVLDTGLQLANTSPRGGRLCPPLLSVLDELPSTAPLPTLRTRMANERALGTLLHLGSPDPPAADQHLRRARSPRTARTHQRPDHVRRLQGRRVQPGDLRPARHRPRRPRHPLPAGASTAAAAASPATTSRSCGPRRSASSPSGRRSWSPRTASRSSPSCTRCVEGKAGERLLADQRALRHRLTHDRRMVVTPGQPARRPRSSRPRRLGFVDDETEPTRSEL